MPKITEAKNGSLAKNKKLNEVIRYLNSLLNMTVREGASSDSPKIISAENGCELITTGGSGEGGDDSAGLPEGYVETDFIMCSNGSPVNGKILFNPDA